MSTSRLGRSKSAFGFGTRRAPNLALRQRLSNFGSSEGGHYSSRTSGSFEDQFHTTSRSSYPNTSPFAAQSYVAAQHQDAQTFDSREMGVTAEKIGTSGFGAHSEFNNSRLSLTMPRGRRLGSFEKLPPSHEHSQIKKKGLKALLKSIFSKRSTSKELPVQQVTSQISHIRHDWDVPDHPSVNLLERNARRVASNESLPYVQTYLDEISRPFQVAHSLRPNFDSPDTHRQTSAETKDSWERGTMQTETISTHDGSDKRLTILLEDEVAQPSNSSTRVDRLKKWQSFEHPMQTSYNQDPYRQVSGLAREIKKRSTGQSEIYSSDDVSEGYPTVLRRSSESHQYDYYRPADSYQDDSASATRAFRSNTLVQSTPAWSTQSTIRKVPSLSSGFNSSSGQSFNGYPQQSHYGSGSYNSRSVSSLSESVYSRDDDGNTIPNDSPVTQIQRQQSPAIGTLKRQTTPNGSRPRPLLSKASAEGLKPKPSIVDYYSDDTTPSIRGFKATPSKLRLAYPRDGDDESDTGFHGQGNDRLQHVPQHQSVADWVQSEKKMKPLRNVRQEPSLRDLRNQIDLEEKAKLLAAVMGNSSQLISHDVPDLQDNSILHPQVIHESTRPFDSGSVQSPSAYETASTASIDHRALTPRNLNRPEGLTLQPVERLYLDPHETPRPSRPRVAHHENSFNQRLTRAQTPKISNSGGRFNTSGEVHDPFLSYGDENVWASRPSTSMQHHSDSTSAYSSSQMSKRPDQQTTRQPSTVAKRMPFERSRSGTPADPMEEHLREVHKASVYRDRDGSSGVAFR